MTLDIRSLAVVSAVSDDQLDIFSDQVLPRSGCRASTIISRWQAVEQAILTMRERLDESLSLQFLARTAYRSPYHFNRVFRHVTGIPPIRFLAALRLEAAKRLLLSTELSVADVCLEVGYNSQGTFTTQFTQLIGMSPRRLRCMAGKTAEAYLKRLHAYLGDSNDGSSCAGGLNGQITTPHPVSGPIFVGLFPTPIPQGRPAGCTLLTSPSTYHIDPVRDGHYYLFAAAFDRAQDPMTYLLPDSTGLYIGSSREPLRVHHGRVDRHVNISLRPMRLIDPPILVALPFLFAEHQLNERAIFA
jgi:AraC family transcriptional regulator